LPNSPTTLCFPTVMNRLYTVDYRDNLIPGDWQVLTNGIVGTGSQRTVDDPGISPQRFYRLRVL